MELQPIGQVSKQYEISIQTLRYYEQIGLIQSTRNDDNAYRFYDETAVKQLHSIILLRKLRISLKQIKEILDNQNTAATVEIFERNISELDEEITSLSTIKSILTRFTEELRAKTNMVLQLDLLNNDTAVLSIADSISFSKNYINNVKENVAMKDLNKAHETLSKLKDSDVRIIYLPPMTVAAAHGLTEDEKTEKAPARMAEKFARETGLLKIKPDARIMMANNFSKQVVEDSKAKHDIPPKEYEVWVSIPDDMKVKAPLTKKTFEGGLYATHLMRSKIFEDSRFLFEWVNESEKYEFDYERPSFLELLNFYSFISDYEEGDKRDDEQCELLTPIKKITG
jgi:DNA-binding transcriptional MerR regulator/DNA gyrase inhibitor GyrI